MWRPQAGCVGSEGPPRAAYLAGDRIIESAIDSLTPRERQVLTLIGRGCSIPQIAAKLFRSQKTIETHRQSLGRKLGVSNRVELARIAIRLGLAPLDPQEGGMPTDNATTSGLGDETAAAVAAIDVAAAQVVGLAYCQTLVTALAQATDVAGAAISRVEGPEPRCVPLSAWYRGNWSQMPSQPIDATPCQQVMTHGSFRAEGTLPRDFGRWHQEQPVPIHSYFGWRLDDPVSQEPLGLLSLIHDEPRSFPAITEPLLQHAARRASAELARIAQIDRLERQLENLEHRLQHATGGRSESK